MAERSLNHEIEQVSRALAEHGLTRRDESRAKTLPDDLNSPAGRPPATAKDPESPRGHEMTNGRCWGWCGGRSVGGAAQLPRRHPRPEPRTRWWRPARAPLSPVLTLAVLLLVAGAALG
ncbi:hypothetical protein [Streptomyces sp. NPDC055134]